MNLPDIFKKLPFQDTMIIRRRSTLQDTLEDGASPEAWETPLNKFEYIYPNSDIQTQWVEGLANPPPNYQYIDEPYTDAFPDAFNLVPDASGDEDRYGVLNTSSLLAGDTVIKLSVKAEGSAISTGALVIIGFLINSIKYEISRWTEGESNVEKETNHTTNPDTSLAWTKADLDALQLYLSYQGGAPHFAELARFGLRIHYNVTGWSSVTSTGGRLRFERDAVGDQDHDIKKDLYQTTDLSGYTHLRFDIEKVTYAGAVSLKVGLYNGDTLYPVLINKYCKFDDTTEEIKCLIPLADIETAGADLSIVDAVGFRADGDDGDYDFYIDNLEVVNLDDENNETMITSDTTTQGFHDVGTGSQIPFELGEVTDRSGTFYLPKDTEIDNNDYIVYNNEVYRVVGINDSYDTHLVIETLLVEVWDESNLP